MAAAGHILCRVASLAVALLLGACAGLPPPVPSPPTQALTDVAGTALARSVATAASGQPEAQSGFRLLPEAAFAFDARIALARRAEKSLDLQYYVWHSDGLGLLLLREVRDAARRGVRVRLLLDDLYTGGQDELLAALAREPNVEVRLFNPLPSRAEGLLPRIALSLHAFNRINHRMHNKQFIADNSLSVTGGRNIADEYFMQGGSANFLDMDVLASGPVVRQQSDAFDRYWNSPHVRPVAQVVRAMPEFADAGQRFDALTIAAARAAPTPRERDVLGRTPVSRQLADGRLQLRYAAAQVFVDDPDKIVRTTPETRFAGSVTESTTGVIGTARESVMIVSPYFIPGAPGMAQMKAASENGVRGVIVTNSLGATDEPLVYVGYARYREEMLRLG
ncbi:MAG: phospholipase D family protein, partial [Comamonadaceae bacterium]